VDVEAPIVGRSAVGVIAYNDLSYEGFPVAAILHSDRFTLQVASSEDNLFLKSRPAVNIIFLTL
jgi:hypothetical protein